MSGISNMEDIEEWGESYILFGKYYRKTLREICELDPEYCINILRNVPEYPEYKTFIDKFFVDNVKLSAHEMKKVKLYRGNVTLLLKKLQPYHYIRLYKCFGGISIIHTKKVHESSSYTNYIIRNKLYSINGVFYDFLIRKHIFNLQNREAMDRRADFMVKYFPKLSEIFLMDYEAFANKEKKVLDILPNIYNTSMLHVLFFGESAKKFDPEFLNLENLKNILAYVSSIPNIDKAIINPCAGTKAFFDGDADLIIEDTLIDFKVSKFPYITREIFFQLIFYAAGFYINDKREFRKFVIYNPLLGLEHTLKLENLDFDMLVQFFEDVIIKNFEDSDEFDYYDLHSLFS